MVRWAEKIAPSCQPGVWLRWAPVKCTRNADVLRSATLVNAELLQRQGQLGELAPGAFADLLLVDGDPLADLDVLCGQGERIDLIKRGGALAKSAL